MQVVESKQLKTDVPSFQVGDTLILHQRLLDGQKERIQTFEGDKVQCASCHDPHDPDERNEQGRDPFLRTSNRESALCLTCHAK